MLISQPMDRVLCSVMCAPVFKWPLRREALLIHQFLCCVGHQMSSWTSLQCCFRLLSKSTNESSFPLQCTDPVPLRLPAVINRSNWFNLSANKPQLLWTSPEISHKTHLAGWHAVNTESAFIHSFLTATAGQKPFALPTETHIISSTSIYNWHQVTPTGWNYSVLLLQAHCFCRHAFNLVQTGSFL